jgi:nucleoside phosphorylase
MNEKTGFLPAEVASPPEDISINISQQLHPIKNLDQRASYLAMFDLLEEAAYQNIDLIQRKIGEILAIKALEDYGFTNIRQIGRENRTEESKHDGSQITYGNLLAKYHNRNYVIQIVTRKKYTEGGKINDRYILIRKDNNKDQVKELTGTPSPVESYYKGIPAWIAVQLDIIRGSCIYSVYFGTVKQLNGNRNISMKEDNLKNYRCLVLEKKISDVKKEIIFTSQQLLSSCDILFIIPLFEEFEILKSCCQVRFLEKQDMQYYYAIDLPNTAFQIYSLILGKTGPTYAATVTVKAIAQCQPRLIVLLGIGGALDKDLLLGDVVVGLEINEFLVDSRATEEQNKYVFNYSGRSHPPSTKFTDCLYHLPNTSPQLFANWQNQVSVYKNNLNFNKTQGKHIHKTPIFTLGNVASGNIVGASKSFAAELLGINRKFKVLEMEAAGVASACLERQDKVDYIIIRGISDFADVRKSKMDKIKNGGFRSLAMTSATTLILTLIQSSDFRTILPL